MGKSALFNRITGSSLAIVYDYPGVTRDRLYTRATWGDTDFVVVDTGGLMSKAAQLPDGQRAAAERAISAAGLPQVTSQLPPHLNIHPQDRAAYLPTRAARSRPACHLGSRSALGALFFPPDLQPQSHDQGCPPA